MIKNKIAIFFLLIANILFLVNIAIPHHHHEKKVCIEEKHCEGESDNHNEKSDKHHKHDNNSEHEYCVLKQNFVLPTNNLKLEILTLVCSLNFFQLKNIQEIIFDYDFKFICVFTYSRKFINDSNSSYLSFVKSSLGLRAPPLV